MSDELHNKFAQIRSRLADLRRSSWRRYRRWDGTMIDRFKRMTPLSEASLRAFEQTHGIELPPDYRAFLATIGESAPGPYGNMLLLEHWDDLASDLDRPLPTSYLAMPYPFVPDVQIELTDENDREVLAKMKHYQGLLAIANRQPDDPWIDGFDDTRCALVVTGAARGRVVYIGDDDRPPYFMPDASFLDWYIRWLDELKAGIDTWEFNHIPRDSEAKLVDVFHQSTSPLDRRDILYALARHQPLTERSDEVLRAGVADPSPFVRTAAVLQLLSRGEHFAPLLVERLQDEDASVRAAAVRVVSRRERFVPLLVERLQDEDASVREAVVEVLRAGKYVANYVPELNTALEQERDAQVLFSMANTLHEVNGLRLASLAKHANSPNEGIRMYIAYFFEKTDGFDGAEGLEQLLSDENATAYVNAVAAFHRRGRDASIAWIAARLARATDPQERDRLTKARNVLQNQPSTAWYTTRNVLRRLGFWWL